MSTSIHPGSNNLLPRIELGLYGEDEGFRVYGTPEPDSRSQTIVFHLGDSKWWIKVTFRGTLGLQGPETPKKPQRCKEFQELVQCIDYGQLKLFDDTVTELILEFSQKDSLTAPLLQYKAENINNIFIKRDTPLTYKISVDQSRVLYPYYEEFQSFAPIRSSDILEGSKISNSSSVFKVQIREDKNIYVHKKINRHFYNDSDTAAIEQELKNLELFRGTPNIIQATGVVISPNPYLTSPKKSYRPVILGILFKYYPEGSLQSILDKGSTGSFQWEKWPAQIGRALKTLHEAGKTHMDIKPSNILIDNGGNAILADISGAGYTHEWLAPEVSLEMDRGQGPLGLPLKNRLENDKWAYGKLLEMVAASVGSASLADISKGLIDDVPGSRTDLKVVIVESNSL